MREAKLLRARPGLLIELDGRIELSPPGRIALPGLGDGVVPEGGGGVRIDVIVWMPTMRAAEAVAGTMRSAAFASTVIDQVRMRALCYLL